MLVPKLRFPEFQDSDNWNQENMSSVATVVMGSSPKSECYNDIQNGLPLLQGNADIRNRLSAPRVFTSEITKECQIGDILMSVRAPVGSVAKSIHHACIGRGIAAIHAKHPNSQEFLYQWLLSYEPRWVNISQGGTFDAINRDDLTQVDFTSPKPTEQQKIAECLSSVDELMAAQARKVDALKTHKKGLMQQLFPREGETQPRLRFSEYHIAGDWEPKTLVDACRMQAGKFVQAADIKELNTVGMYPCYGGNGLRGFTETYSHDGVYPLIGRQGALCGNVKLASERFYATEHAVVATPKQGVEVLWLYYLLNLLNLNRFATGQAQPGLSVDVLEKVAVRIPSDKREQQSIASCLSSLDSLITAETQKHEALKTHKKGLMQQLFPSMDEAKS
jgi:type I restriction enzyme S subunit